MSHRVLFVCAANVCRSPFMATVLDDETSRGSDGARWEIRSRGISVVRSHPMCRVAMSLVDPGSPAAASAAGHQSTQIAHADLEDHDLIITASREERARLARMRPSTRQRTFTLKEAVALGRVVPEQGELRRSAGEADSAPSLAGYADLLDQRRGRVVLPQQTGLRLPWSSPDDPRDVPDVHHDSARRHTRVLKESRDLVRELYGQMSRHLSAGA